VRNHVVPLLHGRVQRYLVFGVQRPWTPTASKNFRPLANCITGKTVWQMTQGDAVNCSCYQEVEAFTVDEQYVIFSCNRTGDFQLYRANLETGGLGQLSDVDEYPLKSII
jgi:hypothetical protein